MNRIHCYHCGFKHVVPLPTDEQLEELYKTQYYESTKPGYLNRTTEETRWLKLKHTRVLDRFKELHPHARSLLEIGCGDGLFLGVGKAKFWDVTGIEPSTVAAQKGQRRGVRIINDVFNKQLLPKLGKYDVVHLGNVLEHVKSPHQVVALSRNLLNDGGLLSVIVPNDDNPIQDILKTFQGYTEYWLHETHLNYFNFDTITALLKNHDIEPVYRSTTFPMEVFLLMGKDYTTNAGYGMECHAMRRSFEHALCESGNSQLLDELYETLACRGLGREVFMIGKI